jgi:hypothetical protein
MKVKVGAENVPLYSVLAALLDNKDFFEKMSSLFNDRSSFKLEAEKFMQVELDDDDVNTLQDLFERIRHLRLIMFKIRC